MACQVLTDLDERCRTGNSPADQATDGRAAIGHCVAIASAAGLVLRQGYTNARRLCLDEVQS